MSNIILRVDVLAGSGINKTCHEAIALADHLGITVEFKFNGVSVLAKPGVKAENLEAAWKEAMDNDRKPKIACDQP